ncbi:MULTISPECIES: GNAT family N-acetyltransferase [Flavobacterium]|uniref:GNAT family N-acetyltransferase n=1 Tax=Flavobacterium TaxID=237 RepID=UPI001FCCB9B6|nr:MULTISPECIES: GNAT family N-acetyltransferase [Flavobacterium]UOK42775.1 GNAT family N-acetyltransferase [Flavobacterium enshiense]
MAPKTEFIPLTLSDIEKIVSMMQEFYAIDNYPIDTKKSKILFREFIKNEHLGKAWLIYHKHEIVGYVILTFVFSFEYGGTIAFLDELYLSESMRGKGIGKEAVRFIQAEAQILKLKIIYLETEEHNENAQKLYLANDFTVHHRKIMKHIVQKHP